MLYTNEEEIIIFLRTHNDKVLCIVIGKTFITLIGFCIVSNSLESNNKLTSKVSSMFVCTCAKENVRSTA